MPLQARAVTASRAARVAAALGSALLVATCARAALASPSAKLVYVKGAGADACPGEDELRRAVAQRLGYDPFFPTAPKTVVAELSGGDHAFHGVVQIVGDDGELRGRRELATKGDDCRELVTSLALAVSLALDDLDAPPTTPPDASQPPPPATPPEPQPPTESPTPTPTPTPSPTATATPTPSATPSATPSLTPSPLTVPLSLGPTFSVGAAPAPSLGASLAAALRVSSASLRLDLRADLPAGGASFSRDGRVSTNTFAAALTGCLHAGAPFACAGGGAGWLWSRTRGIRVPHDDGALVATVLARAGADLPLGRALFLEPFAEGALDLARPRVVVDGITVYQASLFAATFGVHLGIVLR
jgi:hypothetical protein